MHAPRDAGTVPIHVQVIDLQPFSLDMVVPTYLPARDLTQRVARDAGLGAFWEDGTRRTFYLRVRGRLLEDHEKLQDFGVVPHELVHLLPQPPDGSGLEEQVPEYPANRGYAGAVNLNIFTSLMVIFAWSGAWSLGLSSWPPDALTPLVAMVFGFFPGGALSLLVTSFSRHLWGGTGNRARIPLTAVVVYFSMVTLVGVFSYLFGTAAGDLMYALASASVAGAFGVFVGWLAWYGAVEPLPKITVAEVKEGEAMVTWPCGICGGPVTAEVKADCTRGCGRVFHEGCYQARVALGDGQTCAVCGAA